MCTKGSQGCMSLLHPASHGLCQASFRKSVHSSHVWETMPTRSVGLNCRRSKIAAPWPVVSLSPAGCNCDSRWDHFTNFYISLRSARLAQCFFKPLNLAGLLVNHCPLLCCAVDVLINEALLSSVHSQVHLGSRISHAGLSGSSPWRPDQAPTSPEAKCLQELLLGVDQAKRPMAVVTKITAISSKV